MIDVFSICSEVNDLLNSKNDLAARNLLIRLLSELEQKSERYPPVLNQLIRSTGLFPYLQLDSATWDQKFVHQAFAVDVGNRTATLHREQSTVLSKLLSGKNFAVSAPTSFGKSFIIDAFIATRRPATVVKIVPTIALMDETRRRLYKKFAGDYGIVTAPDTPLKKRNILIFPQERAFGYVEKLTKIDLLVIDEFYKASVVHDKERAPSLIKAMIQLSRVARQRYYLAPNIKKLADNVFTLDIEFIEFLDFNTVFLEKHELYTDIKGDKAKKAEVLIGLISTRKEKSLIYAGTYSEIQTLSSLVTSRLETIDRPHTNHFAMWLRKNYQSPWSIADLAERGIGVHNGQMHRCLSQLQIRLFEHVKGFDSIISTSSIIEGVNTSAQNVIIWKSKVGQKNLKDFTFKNIFGRGGRMFKHFVGHIYLLDAPPVEEDSQLEISFPDGILGSLDEDLDKFSLTDKQIERIVEYKRQMSEIVGVSNFAEIKKRNLLQDNDSDFLLKLATDMRDKSAEWRGFAYLNSNRPDEWERMLYKIVGLKPSGWDSKWSKIVAVTKALARNWDVDIPVILKQLSPEGIEIEEFFKIERLITFRMASLLNDANELHKLLVDPTVDISGFVGRVGHAFMPPSVYHLEEYGLPRMISRKIHRAGLINFSDKSLDLNGALFLFQRIGMEKILRIGSLDAFDRYVIKFFFDGISPERNPNPTRSMNT